MPRIGWRYLALVALLLLPLASAVVLADAPPKEPQGDSSKGSGEVRKAGREFVQDVKAVGRAVRASKAGRYVEEGTRDLGRDATRAGRKGWDKAESASSTAADEVRRATRKFWDDVIRTKRSVLEKLRKENSDLKAGKKDGDEPRSEPAKEVP
jgi:hypothetical protein